MRKLANASVTESDIRNILKANAMTKQTVAVVIPLYNKSATIVETIASVLAQTMSPHEIIVVEDGSTDGSAEIVAKIHDPRLRLIRQTNAGVSAARNTGIETARSEWIALIDADDLWSENHLERLTDDFASESVGAFSNLRLETRSGGTLIDRSVPSQQVDNYFEFALEHGGYPISASSIIARRSALIACGMFPMGVAMGEDIDTWARLSCCGPLLYRKGATATYCDVPRAHSVAGNLKREAISPLFADRLPKLIADGAVPARLVSSARRYANFLLLEYARQLLDRDRNLAARAVLLERCLPQHDFARYLKRMARTYAPGRLLYRLTCS